MATPTIVSQGTLNRLRCSLAVANTPALNATSAYMGGQFATLAFTGPFSQLVGTATGAVTSPEPYVFATITVSLLKTQALSSAWVTQSQTQSDIGLVTIYPDSAAFAPVTLDNCVIENIEPAAFDGKDPVVRVTIRGVFYANSALWADA